MDVWLIRFSSRLPLMPPDERERGSADARLVEMPPGFQRQRIRVVWLGEWFYEGFSRSD